MYFVAGLILSLLVTWFVANIILAVVASYIFLLVGIGMALGGKT